MESNRRKFLKKVAIVGMPHEGVRTLVTDHSYLDTVIKEAKRLSINQPIDNSIYINGVRYVPVEEPKRSRKSDLAIATLIAIGGMYGALNGGYERKPPQVNIVEEFKLIQEKKSKLCRSDRDWVVNQFNRLYKAV